MKYGKKYNDILISGRHFDIRDRMQRSLYHIGEILCSMGFLQGGAFTAKGYKAAQQGMGGGGIVIDYILREASSFVTMVTSTRPMDTFIC